MKKIVTFTIVVIFLFCFCLTAYANGGPGDGNDLFIGGNIKFTETPDVFLLSEDLNIKVFPKESEVTVKYTLKNTGAARTLSYIFPTWAHSWIKGKRCPRVLHDSPCFGAGQNLYSKRADMTM